MADKVQEKSIQKPLCKRDGTESDHDIIVASFKLPKHLKSSASTFTFRPITKDGVELFRSVIVPYDWSLLQRDCPTDSADAT